MNSVVLFRILHVSLEKLRKKGYENFTKRIRKSEDTYLHIIKNTVDETKFEMFLRSTDY